MADVFVSYSREDKARAAQIVRLLEDDGWDVFWDQETRAGTLWPKVLEQQIDAARCLVALWTASSIDSRWVRIEAYEALQADKLLPLLLDDVRLPLEFRHTQTIDLRGWSGDRADPRVAQLLADLRALMSAQGVEPEQGADPKPRRDDQKRDKPRNWRIGMAGAAAALLGIAVAWQWPSRPADSPKPSVQTEVQPPLPQAPAAATAAPPASPPPVAAEVSPAATSAQPAPQKTAVGSTARSASPVKTAAKTGMPTRCLEINQKYQSTGQISSAERDLLRSKECQP